MNPGTRLEHYKIVSKLGEGGMGEVYRAEDTRLKREVAIKILPPDLAQDEQRLARLEREAQLLAALNHPNVATVHGFGREVVEDDGQERTVAYLVMELVLGPSLASRVAEGPVPWREAVAISAGIAAGLEAAHERGIVHRDLKPANAHVTEDGTVKVLDFGLAKSFEGDAGSGSAGSSESPTMALATGTGVIMGTAAYMSPEQARGKKVDKRTDIWALGCVLYELLTGRRPFQGDTVSDILASVLKDEPDFDALPTIPSRLRRLLERCLTKQPVRRMRDVGDVRLELEGVLDEKEDSSNEALEKRSSVSWPLLSVVAAVALGGGILVGFGLWGRTDPPLETHAILATHSVARGPTGVAISPDGRFVAEIGSDAIRVRRADEMEWRAIPDSGDAIAMTFTADSQRLYFTRGQFAPETTLHSVGLDGSSPVLEATMGEGVAMVFRGQDGAIMVGVTGRSGYSIDELVPDGSFSPRGSGETPVAGGGVLVTGALGPDRWIGWTFNPGGAQPSVAVLGPQGTEPVLLLEGYRSPVPVGDGRILVADGEGRLFSARLDPSTGALVEPAVIHLEGMALASGVAGAYGVSDDGTLVFLSGAITSGTALAWLHPSGTYELLTARRGQYQVDSRVSPDGARLALEVVGEGTSVWVHDIERDVQTALAPGSLGSFPVWSPDSMHVAYESAGRIYRAPIDSSTAPELLATPAEGGFYLPVDWSPDGSFILYVDSSSSTRSPLADHNDLWLLPAEGGEPRPFLATEASEVDGRFSPDGRFVAYQSDQSGRYEIYVRPLTGSGEFQISAEGGASPEWHQDGSQLFFEREREIRVVDVDTRGAMPSVSPERIFVEFPADVIGAMWHPHPDGERLLVTVRSGATEERPAIHAIFNWSVLR